MPIVVDNNFSRDSHGMRTERLSAIQGNFASIQPELAAPAEIATWAVDCYDKYAELWKVLSLFFFTNFQFAKHNHLRHCVPPPPAEDKIIG